MEIHAGGDDKLHVLMILLSLIVSMNIKDHKQCHNYSKEQGRAGLGDEATHA